jgi:hypothetical protein
MAFYLLAHECGHVHDAKVCDTAFPGLALQKPDYYSAIRAEFIDACWDEYIACRLSADFGAMMLAGYDETFAKCLKAVRDNADRSIRAYRAHDDHDRVLREIVGEYGALMKFGAYLYGHLRGARLGIEAAPLSAAGLENHWFRPYFDSLASALDELADNYGTWSNWSEFEVIAEIGFEVLGTHGMTLTNLGSRGIYVHVA